MRRIFGVLGVVALAAAAVSAGQVGDGGGQQRAMPGPARDQGVPEPTGTGVIRGRVVASDTGSPLRRVQVRLSSAEVRGGRVATTDVEGRFEFRELPGGRYVLSALKAGYVSLQHGQRRPFEPGRPIELGDAQTLDRVDFVLPRGSAITGRVVDEFGEPVAEALVQALHYQFIGGRPRLVPTGRAGQTDDLGHYRIFGLPPGDYYVSASVRSTGFFEFEEGPRRGPAPAGTSYAPTYYPGTPSVVEAQRLTVAIGQEANGVDFNLLPVRTARIAGVVLDSQGRPLEGAFVSLMQDQSSGEAVMIAGAGGTRSAADGSFTLANVAPGDYYLQATTGGRGGRGLPGGPGFRVGMIMGGGGPGGAAMFGAGDGEFATLRLTVAGQDITNLVIATSRGARVTGVIKFVDGTPPSSSAVQNIGLVAMPAVPDAPLPGGGVAEVSDDGSFEFRGLTGRRLIRPMGSLPGWSLKAVEHHGVDVTDTGVDVQGSEDVAGVEVVFTTKATEILGTVTDDRGNPVKDYTVVVFSTDPAKWGYASRYVGVGRPDQNGQFKVRELPPGEYLAVALDYVQSGEWTDPAFLERVRPGADSLRLAAGETRSLTLKPSPY